MAENKHDIEDNIDLSFLDDLFTNLDAPYGKHAAKDDTSVDDSSSVIDDAPISADVNKSVAEDIASSSDAAAVSDAKDIQSSEDMSAATSKDATKVIGGNELFISLGSDVKHKTGIYPTVEYEPEDFGISDMPSLPYVAKGIRQLNAESSVSDDDSEKYSGEFTSMSQRNDVATILFARRKNELLRFLFTLPFMLLLLYMGFADPLSLPLPFFVTGNIFVYIALGLTVGAIGISCVPIAHAVKNMFTAKADADTLLPFAGIASLTLLFVDIFLPDNTHFPLLAAVFVLALNISCLARLLKYSSVLRGFSVFASKRRRSVLVPIDNEKLSASIMGNMIAGGSVVYKPELTRFVTGFMGKSFSPDTSARCARVMTYLSLMAAGATAGICTYRGMPVRDTVYSCACVLLAFLPLTAGLVSAVPFFRAQKKAKRVSSAIASCDAVRDINSVGALVIDSNYLFPDGSVILEGVRTFGTLRIDDAITDAASVVCAAGGALARIFLGVIDNNRSLLRHVDTLLYEDGLGLSAWVNDRRVLVGSAELLRNHGVSVPSRDYETRYAGEGKNIVYVSAGGQLTAMFIISYHARQEIYDMLFDLRKQNIGLVIVNRDCNITPHMITELFDFPGKLINILPPSNEALLGESMEQQCDASIVYSKGIIGLGTTVISSLRLLNAVAFANAVQVGGILLTAALAVYLAVTGGIYQFSLSELLACESVFALLTLLSVLLRRS